MRRTLTTISVIASRTGRYANTNADYLLVLVAEHVDAAMSAVAALDLADAARAAALRAEEAAEYGEVQS
jgi:hypothetical protein